MTIADNNSNTATVADSDVFGIYPSPFSDRAFCFGARAFDRKVVIKIKTLAIV